MTLKEIRSSVSELFEKYPDFIVSREQYMLIAGDSDDNVVSSAAKNDEAVELRAFLNSSFEIINPGPLLFTITQEKVNAPIGIKISHVPHPPGGFSPPFSDVMNYGFKQYKITGQFSNLCWKRFLFVKELMHIYFGLFDTPSNSKGDYIAKCARAIHDVFPENGCKLDAETTAFYLAIEFLLPIHFRDQLERAIRYGLSTYQIAKLFMVPEYIVMHVTADYHKEKGYLHLKP